MQRQADQLEADINSQIEAERLGDIELDDEPRLYFSETDDAVLMPLEYIVPLRAREAGIMQGQKFMLQAAREWKYKNGSRYQSYRVKTARLS